MSSSGLFWSPIYKVLEERINTGDDLILAIVPFVKLSALKQLHWVHDKAVKTKIVCRWRPEDLVSGASDLEVFTYLKETGCQLYINPLIHLKLYVFDSNYAVNTSGNLTLKGLGYSEVSNVEIGSAVQLSTEDWMKIYRLLNTSRQVDDKLYTKFKIFLEGQPRQQAGPLLEDFLEPVKHYTISSLPASQHPETLAKYYLSGYKNLHPPEEIRRFVHDLVLFDVPEGLDEAAFNNFLSARFCKSPFVVDFVEELKKEKSMRFGLVNDWIHKKCEDVPLPYRWEIKGSTSIFYDWLSHFIPEITWTRPNYSQVISWKTH